MKKNKLLIILFMVLCLFACDKNDTKINQSTSEIINEKRNQTTSETINNTINQTTNETIKEIKQTTDETIKKANTKWNDLVHYDYGNALVMNEGSTCIIENLDLEISENEEANIYVYNKVTDKEMKIDSFRGQKELEYTVIEDGAFLIYAKIEKGNEIKYLDLTEQVVAAHICENKEEGIKFLK